MSRHLEEMDDLVEGHEAARILRVHKTTMANWRSQRRGPMPTWIAGKLYYEARELSRWVREQRSMKSWTRPKPDKADATE